MLVQNKRRLPFPPGWPQIETARESACGRRPGGFELVYPLSYGFPVPVRFTVTLSPGVPPTVREAVFAVVLELDGENRTVTVHVLPAAGDCATLVPVQVSFTILNSPAFVPPRPAANSPVCGPAFVKVKVSDSNFVSAMLAAG